MHFSQASLQDSCRDGAWVQSGPTRNTSLSLLPSEQQYILKLIGRIILVSSSISSDDDRTKPKSGPCVCFGRSLVLGEQ
jgi:hypothetical protein